VIVHPLKEMRDQVYGQRCSDGNWEACREYWQRDAKWLREQYLKLPRPLPLHHTLPPPKTS